MPDDEITERARATADALEAKAASVADDLRGTAIEAASKLQSTMRDLAEQMIALAKEMKSLSSYGRRNRRLIRLLAVSVCFDVLLSLGLGILFFRENATSARTDDILAARKDGRAAVCNEVAALVDALIVANPSPDPVAQQAKVDAFAADLQSRSGPLGCKFHFVVPGG